MSTDTETPGAERNTRKVLQGLVTSTKMDKTVVVTVESRKPHPRYGKTMARHKNFYVHDETNDANEGDLVRIMETRPISKSKRWRVVEIVERAK